MTGRREKKKLPCGGNLSVSIKPKASACEPAGHAFMPGHARGKKEGTWGVLQHMQKVPKLDQPRSWPTSDGGPGLEISGCEVSILTAWGKQCLLQESPCSMPLGRAKEE